MSFRKILCVVTGAEGDAGALATAFALARVREGHVAALFLQADPRYAVPMLGEGVSGAMIDDIIHAVETENESHLARARLAYEAACRQAGAVQSALPESGGVTASFSRTDGLVEDEAVLAARLADVTVFPTLTEAAETAATIVLEAVLLGSGRPLVVAPARPPEVVARRVAVAWNGSAEAARAVALALPVLAAADKVWVLTAKTSKTDVEVAQPLADYLAWHGVTAQVVPVTVSGGSVGASVLRGALEQGADLLVMGGYGHSRLREMILGGVTRHVLHNTELPVLMAH